MPTIAERNGYIIPTDPAPWGAFLHGVRTLVSYGGYTFYAKHLYNYLVVADASARTQLSFAMSHAASSDSCAYHRICPVGKTVEETVWFAYWLNHTPLHRGTLAYLTENDGLVPELTEILKKRGFRCVAINRSYHTGSYPVYLFVHPGDKVLQQKTTRKIDLENAEIDPNTVTI